MTTHNLQALLAPSSVALIGASERPGSLGTVVMQNLVGAGFAGPIYPVNPKYAEVQGRAAWPAVGDLPAAPDLALVCTPPATIGSRGKVFRTAVIVLQANSAIGVLKEMP